MRRFVTMGPGFVVLGAAGALLVGVPAVMNRMSAVRTQERVRAARVAVESEDVLVRLNDAVRNVAESVEPSVVHIEVSLQRFRGSSGSGWMYDADGHIVTNAHVVGPVREVTIQFHDGRVATARVIGADPLSDIAVLKVEPGSHIVPARRATDERVRQGDRVFAFGSPFGFKFSMSEGIVSGVGRTARSQDRDPVISNFIQSDAAINPGNSGGPLVDVRGRVVGMNVAIATAETFGTHKQDEGQSSGISFAIPLLTIEARVDQLIAGGPVRAGFMGVRFSASRANLADRGMRGWGVAIDDVTEGGAAKAAGLEPGDVIVAVNGDSVSDSDSLRSLIASRRPETEISLDLLRGDERKVVVVTLRAMPEEARVVSLVEPLLRGDFGLLFQDRSGAVRVLGVFENGPADRCGIMEGDRVVSVAGSPVSDSIRAISLLEKEGLLLGKPVEVVVARRRASAEKPLAPDATPAPEVLTTITLRKDRGQ